MMRSHRIQQGKPPRDRRLYGLKTSKKQDTVEFVCIVIMAKAFQQPLFLSARPIP